MNTNTLFKPFLFAFFITTITPLAAVQNLEPDRTTYKTDFETSVWQEFFDDLERSFTTLGNDVKTYWQEKKLFLQRFIEKHNQVGAVAPSSRFLADKMTEHLQDYKTPITIIEVGAGTGVFTKKIVERMPAGSQLHVIEIDEDFIKLLEKEFGNNPSVHIHCADIRTVALPKADCIISGLPFNAFSPTFVDEILRKYKQLIKRGGSIVYFEYAWLPKLKALWLEEEEREQYKTLRRILSKFRETSESTDSDLVLLNLPPAHVIMCRA